MFNSYQTNRVFHKPNTMKSGWSIVYKIDFVLANIADPNEMPQYVAFHLRLCCLPKYPFRGFLSTKG